MSLIRKHVAVLQAWACLALVNNNHDHHHRICIVGKYVCRLTSENIELFYTNCGKVSCNAVAKS